MENDIDSKHVVFIHQGTGLILKKNNLNEHTVVFRNIVILPVIDNMA